MSYTESDLARLKRALANGAQSVTLADGSRTEYRTVADLRAAIRTVEAELDAADGVAPRRRGVVTHVTKGIY